MPQASLTFRVQTNDPVGFITLDDGYATDPQATAFVQSYPQLGLNGQPNGKTGLPLTQFLTFYAATSGQFPPPSSGQGLDHLNELRKYQTGTPEQGRVGCHGKEHIDYRANSLTEQQAQIGAAADWLGGSDMFNVRPRLYRPPNAQYDPDTLSAAYAAGMPKVVLYTHWVHNGVVENDYGTPLPEPGSIFIVHHPMNPVTPGTTLAQLQLVLDLMAQANLVPAYLHDYL